VSKNHADGAYSPKADAKVAIPYKTAKQSRHFFPKTTKVFAFVYKIRQIGKERERKKQQKGQKTTTTSRKNTTKKTRENNKKEEKRKQKGEEINKKTRKTSKTGDFELNYP
jgi:hypothetical protein